MIADNVPDKDKEEMAIEKPELLPEEKEKPELTPKDLKTVFLLMLHTVKGITVPQKTLDEFPEDVKFNSQYDPENKVWHFFIPKKRKRGLVVPKKRFILP